MGLVAASFARIDVLGEPAYPESSNPANDARYERSGFSVHGLWPRDCCHDRRSGRVSCRRRACRADRQAIRRPPHRRAGAARGGRPDGLPPWAQAAISAMARSVAGVPEISIVVSSEDSQAGNSSAIFSRGPTRATFSTRDSGTAAVASALRPARYSS